MHVPAWVRRMSSVRLWKVGTRRVCWPTVEFLSLGVDGVEGLSQIYSGNGTMDDSRWAIFSWSAGPCEEIRGGRGE
jgi:hypothetical protein